MRRPNLLEAGNRGEPFLREVRKVPSSTQVEQPEARKCLSNLNKKVVTQISSEEHDGAQALRRAKR